MKKGIAVLTVLLIFSFTPEKKYHFEFNDAQLNAIWNCIDNSNAPHSQVKEVEAIIQNQLKGQVSVDSSKLKK